MKQTDKDELNANLKETRILETIETTKEYICMMGECSRCELIRIKI